METKQAWLTMITTPGIEQKIGITSRTRDWLRSQARNHNRYPSTDNMIQHLLKAGYTKEQEMRWQQ